MVRPQTPGTGPTRSRRTSPQKNTEALQRKVRQHGITLIESLIDIATSASSENIRLSAIKELLDRGYGKTLNNPDHNADSDHALPSPPTLIIQPTSSDVSSSDDH